MCADSSVCVRAVCPLLQVIPVNKEGVKEQQEEIEAAKEAALEASTADEEFVPENVPDHLVQLDAE